MDDEREQEPSAEQELKRFQRRGGWLRRTAAPTGERPIGSPTPPPPPGSPTTAQPEPAVDQE
jgi:hypothetical protein